MCSARPVVPAACISFRRRATGAASARPSLRPRFPERAVLQQSSDANCAARPMTRICAWPAVPRRRRRSCRGRMPWCCRTGLNCRPLPYQGSALPLSYGSKGTGGDRPEGRDRTRAVLATRSPPAQAWLVRFSGKDVSVMHRNGAKDLRIGAKSPVHGGFSRLAALGVPNARVAPATPHPGRRRPVGRNLASASPTPLGFRSCGPNCASGMG